MALARLLLSAGLIFALPANMDSSRNYRLPDHVAPIHYDVRIITRIEQDNFTFDGEIAASVEIRRAARDLSLHALNLTIDEAATSLLDRDHVVRTPIAHHYDHLTEILLLDFDDELPAGIYILNMKFAGVLSDDLHGFFRVSYVNEAGDTVWLAVTHFEATYARRAFPCWDEPALKATFNISIKHHRNYTAISNMPASQRQSTDDDDEGDTRVWTSFRTTPVMSTYLVAFAVSDYVRVPNADGTVNTWSRAALAPHSKLVQNVAEQAGQLLTRYTNSTNKMPKMDHFAVAKFNAGAMENWGLVVYHENSFAYNEELHTTMQKWKVAETAAHEMAHQWFGNVVSPLWWSHLWLNEGFASFFQIYLVDQIFKDWRIMETFVIDFQMMALDRDVADNLKPIVLQVNSTREITSLFTLSSYQKAAAILRMLQHIITDEVFRNGLIRFLNTHEFGSANSDDLWSAMQVVLDESDVPHDQYRLKEVMDTWITQRHFPIVQVARNYDTGETTLRQEHFHLLNDNEHIDDDKWWIPVTFTTQTNLDFTDTMPTHWLSPQDPNITIDGIDPVDWIIVNLQEIGYYRVNYDAQNWYKIINYLNSDNYTNIHVLNRAQIIDDAYHLLMIGQFDMITFLDLVTYLSRETDYVAWKPMFQILHYAMNFCKNPENAFLKSHVLEILHNLVENVGYEEDPNENDLTKLQRIDALKYACHFGHSECKKMATVKLNWHFVDSEANKVPPNLKEWTFCNGIMQANASVWNKLLDEYTKERNEDILKYLACSEDPDIIINYLNMIFSNDTLILNDEDYYLAYYSVLDAHANEELVFDYLLKNIDEITSRNFSTVYAFGTIIYSVHSNDKLDKISKVVKTDFNEEYEEKIKKLIDDRKSILSDKFAAFRPYIQKDKIK